MKLFRFLFLFLGLLSNGVAGQDPDVSVFLYDASGHPIASTSSALDAFLTNSTIAVTQSGPWTTGRTWALSSGTDSASCVQGTSPWVVSGTATVSGTVTTNQGAPGPTASPWPVSAIQNTLPWVTNISQFGGSNISIGTGASGSGIPRVTVSNDSNILATQSSTWTVQQGATPTAIANAWPVKPTDGTNSLTIKSASTAALITDTAIVITDRPDNVGTPTQTSVSCAATSTTLLAANTATMFLSIRNPTTSTVTIWINVAGAAAVVGVPSIDLAPGSEADFFAEGSGFLPTSQINCISSGGASSVALMYK